MSRQRKPQKVWQVTYDGASLRADELTWDELEALERASGVAWLTMNPAVSTRVARGFLGLLFERQGKTPEEAAEALKTMTVRDFQGAFRLIDDDRPTHYDDNNLPVAHPNSAPESSTTT